MTNPSMSLTCSLFFYVYYYWPAMG